MRSLIVAVGCLVWAGCGGDTATAVPSDAGIHGAPLAACEGVDNVYRNESCLSSLRDACRARMSREGCETDQPFTRYGVVCTWARVVTFSDPATCAIASDEGRCEGGWTFPGDGPFCGIWYGFPAERELVTVKTCGGPVGPWDGIDGSSGSTVGVCLPNVTPPAPVICNCTGAVESDGGTNDQD